MTLAGLSKRGYHIRKGREQNTSTIASCLIYADEDEGSLSEDDAKFIVKPCPTWTIVKLEKNDQVFIEEIDDNSTVLYSNAVFGLIQIGT